MKSFFLSLLLLLTTIIYSQEDRIDAQRPTLSESFSIINNNIIQAETGVNYDFDASEVTSSTFIRHSFFNRIELRVSQGLTNNDFGYGAKFLVLNNNNDLNLGLSFIYSHNKTDNYQISLTKDFNRLSVTFNTGWDRSVTSGRYNILLFTYLLLPDWSIFVEGQSNGTNNTTFERTIQGGVVFVPTDDIQLDAFVGYNEGQGAYVGGGVSFRINYAKKEKYQITEL